METRLATLDDAPTLAELHAESFGAAHWSLAQIMDSLVLETSQTFIVEEGSLTLGFLMVQCVEDEAEILTFCVTPPARRMGAGKALLDAAIKTARKHDIQRIFLEVAADNEAASILYGNAGFKITGERKGYYARETAPVDAWLMTLLL